MLKGNHEKVFEVVDTDLDYKGWIAIHTLKNNIAFGGCRFDLSVDKEMVMELARCMTLKLASHGLPTGGAKGGLCVDPRRADIKEVIKSFAQKSKEILTTQVILGKDLGATDEMMTTLYQALDVPQMYLSQKHWPHRNVPDRLNLLRGYRKHMTGLGVAYAAHSLFNSRLSDRKVIIQGAGAVGMGAAFRFEEFGAKVVGISDAKNCIYRSEGFSFLELQQWVEQGQIQTSHLPENVECLENSKLFEQVADICVLAATSNSVTKEHSENMKVEAVIEGSNFGLQNEARECLQTKKVVVVPDVIASSSSAAMVCHQISQGNLFTEGELWDKILSSIREAVQKSVEVANIENCDLRQAYTEIVAPDLLEKAQAQKQVA